VTVIYPEGTPTLGNVKVKAGLATTNLAAPALATEINAVTSVDLSCFFYADGWSATASTAKQTKKRRLCTKRDTESLHTTTYSIAALKYVHDPQGADADAGNEARELLQEGAKLYFWERHGLDAQDEPFTVADRVRTHWLELGPQIEMPDPDENGEFYIMQEVAYVNDGPVAGVVAT
jgi:hypothetical protein